MEYKDFTDKERLSAEQSELDSLIQNGFSFEVRKRTFLVKEPYLGTLDHMSRQFIKMHVNIEDIQANAVEHGKILAKDTAMACAMALAIAVLNNKWKIRLLAPLLAKYFYWNIKPSKLVKLVDILNMSCNLGDFIRSIVSMSASRTTKPNPMEQSLRG